MIHSISGPGAAPVVNREPIWSDHNWFQMFQGVKELFQMLHVTVAEQHRLGKPLEVSHPTTNSVLLLFGKY